VRHIPAAIAATAKVQPFACPIAPLEPADHTDCIGKTERGDGEETTGGIVGVSTDL
jgi:hypothetical protein